MQTATEHRPATKPAAAALVTHDVADYQTWKLAFDGHAATRKAAGVVRHHINRSADDPNRLSVYLAASTLAGLKEFVGSDSLKAAMAEAGVKGKPTIAFVTPVEDQTSQRDALAGAIVRHEVADYARWKEAFDAHASARAAAGIVGHAVNRGVNDPNVVVIYLQAESLDAIKAFTASDDLKATMTRAGVRGAPQIAFVKSAGWGAD